MAISAYLKALRDQLGSRLLLLPSVAAVVRDDAGRILFQRRSDDGSWSLPAGAIEPGETPEAAALREVHEETGLHVRVVKLAGAFGGERFRHRYPNGDEVEYVVIIYDCIVTSGTLGGLDDETIELKFFDASKRPRLALPFPAELFDPPRAT